MRPIDRARLHMFHVTWRRLKHEGNPDRRFLKALAASCQPVKDRKALAEWTKRYGPEARNRREGA